MLVNKIFTQVIAWQDSAPKWPITCRAGHKLRSLTHSLVLFCLPVWTNLSPACTWGTGHATWQM